MAVVAIGSTPTPCCGVTVGTLVGTATGTGTGIGTADGTEVRPVSKDALMLVRNTGEGTLLDEALRAAKGVCWAACFIFGEKRRQCIYCVKTCTIE